MSLDIALLGFMKLMNCLFSPFRSVSFFFIQAFSVVKGRILLSRVNSIIVMAAAVLLGVLVLVCSSSDR